MKIVHFHHLGRQGWGLLEGEQVAPLTGSPFKGHALTPGAGQTLALHGLRLLSPWGGRTYLGVALNHPEVAERLGRALPALPRLFFKPASAVCASGDPIVLPQNATRVVHEGELAAVIGHSCRQVSAREALQYVLGYTCTNDVSDFTHAKEDEGNLMRVKCHDSFAPLGPWIDTELDPRDACIEVHVNGELRQHGSTADFVHSVAETISFASQVMTLVPGDVIACGTPPWPQDLHEGDVVDVRIDGLGVLSNPVVRAARA